MLRLVHESDPDDFDERERHVRPERRHAYREEAQVPSVGLRVLRTLAFVAAFAFVAFLAYLAGQARMLDPLIAGSRPGSAQLAPQQQRPAVPAANTPSILAAQPAAQGQSGVPDVAVLAMLVRNAAIALHQANVTNNYAVLLALAAPQFQQRNTPASLAEAFAGVRAADVDLAQVAAVNPVLNTPPAIDRDGMLQLAGFFPIGTARIEFKMAFQLIDGRWRLFGIGVQPPREADIAAAKAPMDTPKAIPPDQRLLALIRTSVAALNQANMTGDYSVLHDLGAASFQAANPPPKLAQAFANIRERGLDLAPASAIDPRLFRPPAIDANGYLRVAGYFPSRPEQVNFDLVFQFERGAWRLFGIGVDSARDPAAPPLP